MVTLEFKAYDILQKYNFSKEDAEALIEYMKEASKDEVATKTDIGLLKSDIALLAKRIDHVENQLDLIRVEIKNSALEVKASLIQWMAGLMIGQMGVIFAILKLTGKL